MSAKPITFVLVAVTALVAGRSLVNAAERSAEKPHAAVVAPHIEKAAPLALPSFDPAKAFENLGCVGCHGDDGIYRDEIKGALGKPVDQVARWIRNAPSIKPDTDMPCFENLIDTPDSIALAGWVLDRAARIE